MSGAGLTVRLNLMPINAKNLPCNSPRRDVLGGKKFVVRACANGQERTVRFGDANMTIKKNQPDRKKSYCARSGGIVGKGNKLSANYWSRRAWNC